MPEADEPDSIADLANADILAGDDGAEVNIAFAHAEAAALGNGDGSVMKGILEFIKALILPF